MPNNNIVSIARCSCGILCDTEEQQVLHYAYAHHHIEPLLEYHQKEIAQLRKQSKITLENIRSELVKELPLMHVTREDIGFDKGIQKAMRIIDKQTTQDKEKDSI